MNKTNVTSENAVTSDCKPQRNHEHQHGETCGCKTVKHGDHLDYVHDGHLHRIHGNHVDECTGSEDASVLEFKRK